MIPVAAKPGTIENCCNKVSSSWFAAYAPAEDPQYVVVTNAEEGGGSQTAAPIVRRILEAGFGLEVTPFEAGAALED